MGKLLRNLSGQLLTASLLMVFVFVSGCKTDLDDVNARLDNLEKEVTALRSLIEKANNDVASLQTTVESLRNSVTISDVEETSDGYIIHFSNGKKSELSNGKTPAVSVEYDAATGNYYWKVNGDYLTDKDGNKIAANGKDGEDGGDGGDGKDGKDAPLPRLEMGINLSGTDKEGRPIVAEAWYVSVDEGATWARVSASADELKFELTVSGNEIIIKFADGTELKVPFVEGFYFIPERTVVEVGYGQTATIAIEQNKVVDTHITKPDGWRVNLNGDTLEITAPDEANPYAETNGVVSILAIAQGGFVAIAKINVEAVVPPVVLSGLTATYESWGMNRGNENAYLMVFTTEDYDEVTNSGAMLSLDLRGYVTHFYDGISEAYEGLYESGTYAGYYFGPTTPQHHNMVQDSPDSKFSHPAMFGNQEIRIDDASFEVKRDYSTNEFSIWGSVYGGGNEFKFIYEGPVEFSTAIINLYELNRFLIGYEWEDFTEPNEENDLWYFQMHNVAIYSGMFMNAPGDVVSLTLTAPYVEGPAVLTEPIGSGTYKYSATGNPEYGIVEMNYDIDYSNYVGFIDGSGRFRPEKVMDGEITVTSSGSGALMRMSMDGWLELENGVEVIIRANNRPSNLGAKFIGDTDLTADLDLTDQLVNYTYEIIGEYGGNGAYNHYLYLGTSGVEFEQGYWESYNHTANDHVMLLCFNTPQYAGNGIAAPGRYKADEAELDRWNLWNIEVDYMEYNPYTFEWGAAPYGSEMGWGTQYIRADDRVIAGIWGYRTDDGYIDVATGDGIYYEIEFELYDDLARKRPNMVKGNFKGNIVVDPGQFDWSSGAKRPAARQDFVTKAPELRVKKTLKEKMDEAMGTEFVKASE